VQTDINIDLYEFDRCTGLLNNHLQIKEEEIGVPGGVAFSPSGQFMYIAVWDKILQFDLTVVDIAASRDTVAIYDGFVEWITPTLSNPTRFYNMQNGPDGKIYISCPNTSSRYLHVIDEPDSAGIACNFLQHHIELPSFNNHGLPNFPNYRLGALEGSPCDTLPQPMPPLAAFSCTTDTINTLSYTFTDQSSTNTNSWLWDFGDNNTSTEQNPTHLFPGNGTYEVCLTASNDIGTDSTCKEIDVQTVSTDEHYGADNFFVYPNPAKDFIYFSHSEAESFDQAILYDVTGRKVKQLEDCTQMSLAYLSSGIYFVKLLEKNQSWISKIVIE
ncbi:MAG: PKD domain-containing protein, partial [Saprospiraceae bacterium]